MNPVALPLMRPQEYRASKLTTKRKVYVGPKLDGVRVQIYRGQMYTRTGEKVIGADHYAEVVARAAPSWCVEGEFYHHAMDFDTISGILRDHSTIYRKGRDCPKVHLFDVPNLAAVYSLRRIKLLVMASRLPKDMFGYVMDYSVPATDAIIRKWYKRMLAQGYEGLMIKTKGHMYQDCRPAKRSWDWMRLKPELTADATIIGIIEGKGKYANSLGAFQVEDKDRRRFKVGGGKLTDTERSIIYRFPNQYLGRCIEFAYARRNRAGGYRHPRYSRFRNGRV